MKINKCDNCGPLPVNHWENWLTDFFRLILDSSLGKIIPQKLNFYFWEQGFYRLLAKIKLLRPAADIDYSRASRRTTVFINEAKKCGVDCQHLLSPFGPTNHFQMSKGGRIYFFEGLPRAEHLENQRSQIIDDKARVKKLLQKTGLPTTKGESFWWFRKNSAVKWAAKNLRWPMVVKPRLGSMSQHITVNIQDEKSLKSAINKAVCYSPAFIVEEFLENAGNYRATVVDFQNVFCVRRLPAHVVGDGQHTIAELITIKNNDPRRGNPRQKNTTLYKVVLDQTAEQFLKQQNYSYRSVLAKEKCVYLQEKIILDLGGDLWEETEKMHPDNRKLFQKVAALFNSRLVGIDFLIKDISLSWKSQPCAIIELNSLPYIDMHHFPTKGTPVNVATALCQMVKKYYK